MGCIISYLEKDPLKPIGFGQVFPKIQLPLFPYHPRIPFDFIFFPKKSHIPLAKVFSADSLVSHKNPPTAYDFTINVNKSCYPYTPASL